MEDVRRGKPEKVSYGVRQVPGSLDLELQLPGACLLPLANLPDACIRAAGYPLFYNWIEEISSTVLYI